ncbi:hypothetical protein BB561_004902 [Smittium simulii]|uniref:Uncharacterized protein n=1 Tax=Smittium simulii TaxID=133385 RepID=A0A2T9YDJ1_9FUNG|nr:hypothetical protein BB561_004902 [Smittium simulii]
MGDNILQIPVKTRSVNSNNTSTKSIILNIPDSSINSEDISVKLAQENDLEAQAIMRYVAGRIKSTNNKFYIINMVCLFVIFITVLCVSLIAKSLQKKYKLIIICITVPTFILFMIFNFYIKSRRVKKLVEYENTVFKRRSAKDRKTSTRRTNLNPEKINKGGNTYLYKERA